MRQVEPLSLEAESAACYLKQREGNTVSVSVYHCCCCCCCFGSSQSVSSSSAARTACCRSCALSPNTAASPSCSPASCSSHTVPSEEDSEHVVIVVVIIIKLLKAWRTRVLLPHSRARWTATCSRLCRTLPTCLRSGCAASWGWAPSSRCRDATAGLCSRTAAPVWRGACSLGDRTGRAGYRVSQQNFQLILNTRERMKGKQL